jgi:hypothetical protein
MEPVGIRTGGVWALFVWFVCLLLVSNYWCGYLGEMAVLGGGICGMGWLQRAKGSSWTYGA